MYNWQSRSMQQMKIIQKRQGRPYEINMTPRVEIRPTSSSIGISIDEQGAKKLSCHCIGLGYSI